VWRQEHTRSRAPELVCNAQRNRTIGDRGREGSPFQGGASQSVSVIGSVFFATAARSPPWVFAVLSVLNFSHR
jgi:hypothetical protein